MKVIVFKSVLLCCVLVPVFKMAHAQQEKGLFKKMLANNIPTTRPMRYYEILCARNGAVFTSSTLGLIEHDGYRTMYPSYLSVDDESKNITRSFKAEDSIKSFCEGIGNCVFFVTHDNKIIWFPCDKYIEQWVPSFEFPPKDQPGITISKVWCDDEGTLFIGTEQSSFYVVQNGANEKSFPATFKEVSDLSDKQATKQLLPVKEIMAGNNTVIKCFSKDALNENIIWVGTNHGLFRYNKINSECTKVLSTDSILTVTNIEAPENNIIWFSTLEQGMGRYDLQTNTCSFFHYSKLKQHNTTTYPVKTFCRKSQHEFFVAVLDSVPAIFNMETGSYTFIKDSIFHNTADSTTDIKLDALGNLFIIKGGGFYYTQAYRESRLFSIVKIDSSALAPYISVITINGQAYGNISGNFLQSRYLKEIHLKHDQNGIVINYSLIEFGDERNVQFAWKIDGYVNDWVVSPYKSVQGWDYATLPNLDPGKYVFHLKAKVGKEDWRRQEAQLIIIIEPPFWQTWWFWLSVFTGVSLIVFAIVKWRVSVVRKQERLKAKHEKELLELEAKALRAQMNPHFIFNCMNSIKALVQKKEDDKAVTYLTTFSKLIRTIFQNSDKREITLFDELETCRLYMQLESMRFGKKFSYHFNIDETIDLKSMQVPALIIQPFIENAIWHGIMPKEEGGTLTVTITKKENAVSCIIDDDGIGREMSKQNKFKGEPSTHQSKGVHLTQNRLDLNNLLNQRNASVEIIDKRDAADKAAGTKIVLTFKEY